MHRVLGMIQRSIAARLDRAAVHESRFPVWWNLARELPATAALSPLPYLAKPLPQTGYLAAR
jgi:hypothetical protein